MSTSKILVAKGSKNGSPAGVADMIAGRLESQGSEAESRWADTCETAARIRPC